MSHSFRYLSKADICKTLSMGEAIDLMASAFTQLSQKQCVLPLRQHIGVPRLNSEFLIMPVCSPESGFFGLKTVSIQKENPSQGLPLIHGLILLLDAKTGQPKALMDAEWLTALRTGAGSGLATKLLAQPEASVAAIVGAGAQAKTQLRAICEVRPIKKVWILNRSKQRAEQFAKAMSEELDLSIEVAPDSSYLRQAQIICTATSASTPLFNYSDLSPGVHINAVGSYRPDMHEVPLEILKEARVFVDQTQAVRTEAGLFCKGSKEIDSFDPESLVEIGMLAAGQVEGRVTCQQMTLFKSVGNAIQDLAVAGAAYHYALANHIGVELPL